MFHVSLTLNFFLKLNSSVPYSIKPYAPPILFNIPQKPGRSPRILHFPNFPYIITCKSYPFSPLYIYFLGFHCLSCGFFVVVYLFIILQYLYHRTRIIILMIHTSNDVFTLFRMLQGYTIAYSFLNLFSDYSQFIGNMNSDLYHFLLLFFFPSFSNVHSYSFKNNPLVVPKIIHALFYLFAFEYIIFSAHILKHLVCDRYSNPLSTQQTLIYLSRFFIKYHLPREAFLDFLRET